MWHLRVEKNASVYHGMDIFFVAKNEVFNVIFHEIAALKTY